MKRFLILMLFVLLLCGCSAEDSAMEQTLRVREVFQNHGCTFLLEITAESDDTLSQFSLQCNADKEGNISFEVVNPESIQGISGSISELGGQLIFDDLVYGVDPVFGDTISPILAPWLLIRGLCSGYIEAASKETDGIRVHINDTYHDAVYTLHIWIDQNAVPVHVDYMFDGRRILSASIRDFVLM